MKVYLADAGTRFKSAYTESKRLNDIEHGELFVGTNILQSFYYCDSFTETTIIPYCQNFLLDSGAFTFMSSAKKAVDWDDYLQRYIDFINRNNIKRFFELDIDSVVGYDRVKELRRKLEAGTGKPCIPVWHKSRGKEEYIQMCKEYGYVAIGGIVSKEIPQAEHKYFPWFINKAHEYGAIIHGLGYTSINGLTKYHFDSVDSTSWTSGNRFGMVYTFDGKTINQHKKPEGVRIDDHYGLSLHNFNEWVKFQKYAETHL